MTFFLIPKITPFMSFICLFMFILSCNAPFHTKKTTKKISNLNHQSHKNDKSRYKTKLFRDLSLFWGIVLYMHASKRKENYAEKYGHIKVMRYNSF